MILINWMNDQDIDWLIGWMIKIFIDWLIEWSRCWLIDWMIQDSYWLIDWMIKILIDWLTFLKPDFVFPSLGLQVLPANLHSHILITWGGGTVGPPLSLVFPPVLKISLGNPYLKILDLTKLFIADAPMKKKNQKI